VHQSCENVEELCIHSWKAINHFYNDPTIQAALGVKNVVWSPVDMELELDFVATGAIGQSVMPAMKNLLNSGTIRVLVLNGDLDSLVWVMSLAAPTFRIPLLFKPGAGQ
jgi:hypothetical protein